MPVLQSMSAFRDAVRKLAQNKATPAEILLLCDKFRDEDMLEHGVVLEDREDGKALVKLVDKQTLIQQRLEKAKKDLERQREKKERQMAEEAKRIERLERGRTPPQELFKTAEYSEWDSTGIPLKDKDGAEITKSKRKKLEKEFNVQSKLHEEFLASK
jgi:cysteinyl-tRNA synthetase